MPDDQNSTQNQDSENNSIPSSPRSPPNLAPDNTTVSEPPIMPPEASEAPRNSESIIPVNNDNLAKNDPETITSELSL